MTGRHRALAWVRLCLPASPHPSQGEHIPEETQIPLFPLFSGACTYPLWALVEMEECIHTYFRT